MDQRTAVIRTTLAGLPAVNVNDEIGLEPYSDYSISEYLEDLEREDCLVVLRRVGDYYHMTNGRLFRLDEVKQPVTDAMLHPPLTQEFARLVESDQVAQRASGS